MIKPFIPIRGINLFQFNELEIEIGRDSSLAALKLGQSNYENTIILASQKDSDLDQVEQISDLQEIAFIAKIIKVEEQTAGTFKVVVIPFRRIKLTNVLFDETNVSLKTMAEYEYFDLQLSEVVKGRVLYRSLYNLFTDTERKLDEFTKLLVLKIASKIIKFKKIDEATIDAWFEPIVDPEVLGEYDELLHPILFTSLIAQILDFGKEMMAKYNNNIDWIAQGEILIDYFASKTHEHEVESAIEKQLRSTLTKQQKDFLLREKLKMIRKELGENPDDEDDDEIWESSKNEKEDQSESDKARKSRYPKTIAKLISNEKSKLKNMMSSSPDANIARNYIDLLTELPWRKVSIDELDISKTKTILDREHYGLKNVKERVLEYIAVMINNDKKNPQKNKILKFDKKNEINLNLFAEGEDEYERKIFTNVPILTLVGPPGTGKTSLAKSIAEALNKKFIKISLGGIKDESEIRGHRRTYVGALPGKIIAGIRRAGVSNPVILLDEIDKMASSYKGDPSAAMLEVLDPEQNHKFQDHYLEHEYDLSKVLFIATANNYEDIPAPLLDRVEIIDLSSYTILEKVQIARNYLLAKVLKDSSLDANHFNISDDVLTYVINHYTLEAGVRNLKRVLDKIARKIVVKILDKSFDESNDFTITKEVAFDLLGVHKFNDDENDKKPAIGSVNGLAYTSYGGSTLKIEVNYFKGKGKIQLTGRLKDVMQESAQAAMSFVRSNYEHFGIESTFNWDEVDFHIHVPAGAIPKDGPSAGVTFTTAIISAISKREVPHNVGMTGEITLRGKVLPIGGLKEKSIAANKFGITTVFIPSDNVKDLVEVPDEVRAEINYYAVSEYIQIYNQLFLGKKAKKVDYK